MDESNSTKGADKSGATLPETELDAKKEEELANLSNNMEPEDPGSPTEDNTERSLQDYKIINDPVHGHIQLDSMLMAIIDTPQFQRLRDIKQLGGAYRVFPGASHNRFEHAIGVCYLAGEVVQALKQTQTQDVIDTVDIMCVKIAGLCYNLGYGPFSHVFNQLCEKRFPNWKVESVSVVMFRHLIEENNLKEFLSRGCINDTELEFIESLINPEAEVPEDKKEKAFLRKVVRDHATCIDVVTMDSIARDSYLLNLPCNFDHKRLVKFVRLNSISENDYVICYRDKEAQDLYAMLLSRLSLQNRAYKHKTVQLIEWMLERALTEADATMKFTDIGKKLLSQDEGEWSEAAKKYTRLTDYVTDRIMESNHASMKKSQKIIQDIEKRRLCKFVGTVLSESKEAESELKEWKGDVEGQIPNDCLMLTVEFCFGTEVNENPVDAIYFYSKTDANIPVTIKKEQVSRILPERFTDFVLRVYHKRADPATYAAVERQFQDALLSKRGLKWVNGFTPYAFPIKPNSAEGSDREDPDHT